MKLAKDAKFSPLAKYITGANVTITIPEFFRN